MTTLDILTDYAKRYAVPLNKTHQPALEHFMSLVLNEEQRLLKDAARDFVQQQAPIELLRTLRDEQAHSSYSKALWQQMIELGWAAITIDESYDGLGFGYSGLSLIFEEIGHTLCGSPLISNAVLAASLIELAGTETQKQELLSAIAQGERNYAVALNEGSHYEVENIQSCAEPQQQGYVITGTKTAVLHADQAEHLLISVKLEDRTIIFQCPIDQAGIRCEHTKLIDGTCLSNIHLDQVQVSQHAILGDAQICAQASIDKTMDRANISLCAEMLGSSLQCFQRTMEYLKEREQFGVKIGSFQALKHRASQMFIELELCKSVVLAASNAIDNDDESLPKLASLAKCKLAETFTLITDEATQMHGGMGVTDELDIGLFLKRSRVYRQLFGSVEYHRDRYAQLHGY